MINSKDQKSDLKIVILTISRLANPRSTGRLNLVRDFEIWRQNEDFYNIKS